MTIILSNLRNPYVNLAIEHYLFKNYNVNRHSLLYLYTNNPCVVIGRNQNPWSEINIPLANKLNIPIVRRRSGGGTVVHDLGNLNFCLMTSRDMFSRDSFAHLIVDALNRTKTTELQVNERHDIVIKNSGAKVSGSAYKIEKERAYHHGTMLLNSDLNTLRELLHRDVSKLGHIEGRGVGSIKSPVSNAEFDKVQFIQLIMNEFWKKYNSDDLMRPKIIDKVEDLGTQAVEEIDKIVSETSKWNWIFGKTPLFTHRFEHEGNQISFTVDKGHIISDIGNGLEYKGETLAKNESVPSWIPELVDGYGQRS